MESDRRRLIVRSAFYSALAVSLILMAYLAVTGFSAMRSLSAAKTSLVLAQDVVATDPARAQDLATQAQQSARAAAGTLSNPVWSAVSAVPYFGATPKAAAVISESLDQAITAVEPALTTLNTLNPALLVQNGQIDINPIEAAVPIAGEAIPGVRQAQRTLAGAPTEGLLLGPVEDAQAQLAEQLNLMDATLTTAVNFGEIAGPLLGQEGQRRYFLALLNPNEARGTGGFMGTYAILTVDNGTLSVGEIGSNTDIPDLPALPATIGDEFRARYGEDPTLKGNMNLSPHFPDTAQLWLAAWELKTGEKLDGAMALDVVSLGQLINASGQQVALPDGSSLDGTQLTDFAISGIYSQFPNSAQRKLYQEAVAMEALRTVTALPKPVPMAQAFGRGFSEGRIVAWSADERVEKKLEEAGISGSIAVAEGPKVQVVVLNSSGSKLDAWLSRSVRYDVGRCPTGDGRVDSSVKVDVRSDVPFGERPPANMIGYAKVGPNGPINSSLVQVHLPTGAEVTSVTIDGTEAGRFTFTEQGRPAVLVGIELPPRVTKRIAVRFSEPLNNQPGEVSVQPLASEQPTTVRDVGCS